ncbi:hypothetical protein SORBI_3003G007000 [Sorghum bicolor]|uniref:Protein FAR1-RELATED SEQUENCE n=1 Tax=Sorghum bicolor TaxID=4558 RepID=A0A1W0VV91_SORBI|nr:hypothetical protein SORBI_3003G007000 [Sorghum bicolor]
MTAGDQSCKQTAADSSTLCSSQFTQSMANQVPNPMSQGPLPSGNEICADRPSFIHSNPVSTGPIPLRRKRGKHGPEARIAPLEENPVTQAMKSYINRLGEPVFLPAVGMEFNSAKEAKDFYNLYSWEIGFGIRKGRNRTNENNYMTRQDLVCSCEGLPTNINASSCRTGCKAMIRLHRSSDHGWVISRVETKHNHPLSATYGENKQWPSHSEIDPMTKDFVQKLRENNIPIGRVCSILGVHGCQAVQPIRREAVRSLCARLAQENIKDDIGKTVKLLQEMKRSDVGMDITFAVDDDGKITSLLWCTGKNRSDYAKFGDVVTFDTTYRTNLYNLPFGLFVGVNNHFQSIVFGGVLLTSERIEDFEWCFNNFVEIMGDQCQAMASAIKSTLKNTRHRWCRWHVLRKTKQKVGPPYSKHSNFKKEFNKLVTEETMVNRFERKWRQLIRKYNLENNQFLQRLYKYRSKWAKPYFMDIFCAGMTSTQRSESANHMLKQFIQRSAPMHMFVRKFNEFQMDRNDQEGKEVHLTKQMRRKRRVGVPIERHAESIYTRRMYDKFYNELYSSGGYVIKSKDNDGNFEVAHSYTDGNPDQVCYKVRYDGGDNVYCQCGLYEHMGMLCRHSLKVLVHLDVKEVPSGNIMPRWLKNDPEPETSISATRRPDISGASVNVLKKRALLNCILQVAYGPDDISDEAFTQAMSVVDSLVVRTTSSSTATLQSPITDNNTNYKQSVAPPSVPMPKSSSTIRCPDRPINTGRPPHSTLKSWKDQQKRARCASTDEENPREAKTRRIVDVMAFE